MLDACGSPKNLNRSNAPHETRSQLFFLRPVFHRNHKLQSRPDSVTAQTLISTNPASSPLSRTNPRQIGAHTRTLLWPGDPQHPSRSQRLRRCHPSRSSAARDFTKRKTKSRAPRAGFAVWHFPKALRNSAITSAGTCIKAIRNPSLIPSFLARGVPEYPGIS